MIVEKKKKCEKLDFNHQTNLWEVFLYKNESMEFVQRRGYGVGGLGANPQIKFGISFGFIEIRYKTNSCLCIYDPFNLS